MPTAATVGEEEVQYRLHYTLEESSTTRHTRHTLIHSDTHTLTRYTPYTHTLIHS
jgi:hypothetical protein